MNSRTKMFFTIVTTIMIMFFSVNLVSAGTGDNRHRCNYHGCQKYQETNNGTVFCNEHAQEYWREKGYKACHVTGCYAYANKDSSYCWRHECRERSCKNMSEGSSGYCVKHNIDNKSNGTASKNHKTIKTSSGSHSRLKDSSGTKKKIYDPYDVYNYKSAQDFADDKYEELFYH